MNKDSNWLETVSKLVADKETLQAPSVTTGSSEERLWPPPAPVGPDAQE